MALVLALVAQLVQVAAQEAVKRLKQRLCAQPEQLNHALRNTRVVR